jgi:hypothetical protein
MELYDMGMVNDGVLAKIAKMFSYPPVIIGYNVSAKKITLNST